MGTLKPIDYPTFLDDLILVLDGHQEVSDRVAPLKMYPDSHLATYILKAFARTLGRGDHHADVTAFAVVVVTVSLVSLLGLIYTVSIVDVGLECV